MDFSEYMTWLKRYPDFSDGEHSLPRFIYAEPTNENLKKLLTAYGLKHISGSGAELTKILKLMEWVYIELSNSGESTVSKSIEPLNAANIIETSKRERPTLFCSHKAIVLTESLLAIGIKARLLTCLPAKFDGDCHVVTMAFIHELNKWAIFDPTFNTFFHDGRGTPISILEVRNSYRDSKLPAFRHITLPKTGALMMAGVEYRTYDAWYSVYMAKNCFRFFSPLISECGHESNDLRQFVYLDPKGYEESSEYDSTEGLVYRTDNIRYFLDPPR